MSKIYKPLFIASVLFISMLYTKQALAQVPVIGYSGPQSYSVGSSIIALSPANTGGTPAVNGQTTTFSGAPPEVFDDPYTAYSQPLGATTDALGNVYIAEGGAHRIQKISPSGYVTIFAGSSSGAHGYTNGQGTMATFYHPVGMAADASGNIYVADEDNHAIRKITPLGVVTTFAGTGAQGSADGTGTAASFYYPCGVAVDASGTVYVADTYNNKIRKITPAGVVTTLAGSGTAGSTNATGTAASFNQPFNVAVDALGNVYVTDRANHKVRKITSAGVVTTLAGTGTAAFADGTGTAASFNAPTSVTIDKQGNLYVTDENNQRIRKIVPSTGAVSTLSGTGAAGAYDGIGTTTATFNLPFGIAADILGNVYVGDYTNNLIRKVVYAPYTIAPLLPAGLGFNVTTGTISGTPTTLMAAASYTINAYNALGKSEDAPLSIAVVASNAPTFTPTTNYVATYVPRVSGIATNQDLYAASSDAAKVNVSVGYSDGLGRPLQTVQVKGSPTQRDLVQPVAYDQYGRESIKYLPYVVLPSAADDGTYKATAIADQASFYANPTNAATWNAPGVTSTPFPVAETSIEASPLNRPIEQGAPGDNWQLTGKAGAASPGHTTKIAYATNNATSQSSGTGYWAKLYGATFLYTYNGNYLYKSALADLGSYGLNQLYVSVTKNENWSSSQANLKWNTTEVYKDKLGKLILKRTFNYNSAISAEEILSTYYVYDGYGNLTYVLPPGANPDAGNITQAKLDAYCYQYRYDGGNRQIGKRIPGQGWQLTLYNKLDQAVGTQDSVQRMKSTQQWLVTKYDGLGRTILTATYNHAGSTPGTDYRATLQAAVDAQASQWESKSTTGNGYTATCWPTSGITTYALNYYDDYVSTPGGLPYAFASGSKMTRGQLTAKKTAILNTPANMLWTQNFYDEKDRAIRTFQQHYLGGVVNAGNYDMIDFTYDFANAVTTTTRQHFTSANTASPLVTISSRNIYDHVGRKLKAWEQIQNLNQSADTRTLLSKIDYNEIGQMTAKYLHSTDSVAFKQDIAYAYNERGWLLKSNAQLFEEQLQYNSVSNVFGITPVAQYNGNIASQSWGTRSSQNGKSYTFSYDKLDRLLSGVGIDGTTENNIAYDVMGNITSLNRYQAGGTLIDQLSYSYTTGAITSNRLQSVNDAISNDAGAKHGLSTYASYDGNGNVLVDQSRVSGTVNIGYNMLNLPQTITGAKTITYTYDANGEKLRRVSPATGNTDYVSGIQYDGTTASTISLIQTEEGAALPSDAQHYNYEYFLADHLGNTRITFDTKTGVANTVQPDDYYPFGMEINSTTTFPKNEYLYNGKELQEELGRYDYDARFYDPVIARWTSIDPLSETSRAFSPYNYVEGNPIRNIDPDGMEDHPAGGGQTLEFLQTVYGSNNVQVEQLADKGDDPPAKKPTPKGYWATFGAAAGQWDIGGGVAAKWEDWTNKPDAIVNDISGAYWNAIQVFTTDYWVNAYHQQVSYWSAPKEDRAKDDAAYWKNMLVGAAAAAPFGEASVFGKVSPLGGGRTFAEYKLSQGGTETLQLIKTPNGVQRISTEFHHGIITQRMQKSLNLPNWLVNNKINVWRLNTIQHSLIDPYRFQFLRSSFKQQVGWFGEYNWFTKYPKKK